MRFTNHAAFGAALLTACLTADAAVPAADTAQASDLPPDIEEVTIVGRRERARQIAGAAHVVGRDVLERFEYANVQRIMRLIPGVSVQVEDGYGLRPNISIRGVASERSGRITLLEDGVLIAPAPYSAPAAYYFPTAGRMHAFEVLKGPSAITQGPYTIGGAFNMVSTPIPAVRRGNLVATAGQHGTGRLHATYGGRGDAGFGFLLETHQWHSNGFQDIDRSSRDTGLTVRDYMLKTSYAPRDGRHAVSLKLQWADQASNQSYLGVTDVDFEADPYRRYGLSALDRIDTDHEQAILRYQFTMHEEAKLAVTLYRNEHARNWFKTEGIDFDGSPTAERLSRVSWYSVVAAVNRAESLRGVSSDELKAILHGADTPPGSIQVRANDRQYVSQGAQFALDWQRRMGRAQHRLEVGLRLHEDESQRLQRNSAYQQLDGALTLTDLGLLGNAGNRVQRARAAAFHIRDQIEVGRWTLTPGLRYEDIDQDRTRYEIRAGRTANPASRAPDNLRDRRDNTTRIWLPGLGVSFQASDRWRIFAGAHKGFTAPSNAPDVDAEEALNYELGVAFADGRTAVELTAFMSDYDNLLGECTASSGVDCEVGDAFNGDAATVYGVEAHFKAELAAGANGIPLAANVTWMDTRFDSDIADTDFFGDVGRGDPIPYIPRWQGQITLGWQRGPFDAYMALNYVDETCVRASCAAFEKTDAELTLDVSGAWAVSDAARLFVALENMTDATGILGRHPYGARPNKGRTATVGLRLAL